MLRRGELRDKVRHTSGRLSGAAQLHRLSILYMLAYEPLIVGQIVDILGLPPPLVDHHLNKLYETGWVKRVNAGRSMEYSLNYAGFLTLIKLFLSTPFGREELGKKVKLLSD